MGPLLLTLSGAGAGASFFDPRIVRPWFLQLAVLLLVALYVVVDTVRVTLVVVAVFLVRVVGSALGGVVFHKSVLIVARKIIQLIVVELFMGVWVSVAHQATFHTEEGIIPKMPSSDPSHRVLYLVLRSITVCQSMR